MVKRSGLNVENVTSELTPAAKAANGGGREGHAKRTINRAIAGVYRFPPSQRGGADVTSLYSRATPSQHRILRAVEGAVRNAAHAHPDYLIDDKFARSVAKRAAGTLTAQWPEVLAASAKSSGTHGQALSELSVRGVRHPVNRAAGSQFGKGRERGASHVRRRSPLKILWGQLSQQMRAIKASGNVERELAFIDALRMVDALMKAEQP